MACERRMYHDIRRFHFVKIRQIIYVAVIGVVMLAAFLEWFLWLAAFLYCLIKVYQKAENWTTKVLAVVIMVLFFTIRFAVCTMLVPLKC